MTSRVLVTGATGFIGAHLMARLAADDIEAVALVRASSRLSRLETLAPDARLVLHDDGTASLVELMTTIRPDVTLHVAGHYVADHTAADVDDLIGANLVFGTQVLEALAASGCTRIVTVGSYFEHAPGTSAMSLYAASKRAFDDILGFYRTQSGIKFATCVLHDVYGPSDWRPKLVPRLIDAAITGSPMKLGDPQARINLVHIDDVTAALDMCARGLLDDDPHVVDHRFSVRQPASVALADLVSVVEAAAGSPIDARWNEYALPRLVLDDWDGPSVPGWQPRVDLAAGMSDALAAVTIP